MIYHRIYNEIYRYWLITIEVDLRGKCVQTYLELFALKQYQIWLINITAFIMLVITLYSYGTYKDIKYLPVELSI